MAEDESDQESERLGEELEAIAGPRILAGVSPALSSQYYCRRFCQAWPTVCLHRENKAWKAVLVLLEAGGFREPIHNGHRQDCCTQREDVELPHNPGELC